jgi:DNA-binding XRE family transcriptional regulator
MSSWGDSLIALTLAARAVLGHGQAELGDLVGSSRRTVQRWDAGRGAPSAAQLAKLAAAVFPRDRELAQRLAQTAGTTLEGLGLAPQPAPSAVSITKPA